MNIGEKIENYFGFAKHQTTVRTEVLAGISTFLALSYIFVVNPAILVQGGMNFSAVFFATIVSSALATILMGLWAKKPFAVAPGLEMNAWVAFFVIGTLGLVWQDALGAVFWSGIICVLLAISGIRQKVISAIPDKLKTGLALSVGVFLMLVSLKLAGVLVYTGVQVQSFGQILSPSSFVLVFGLLSILLLKKLKIKGSVLISIVLASILVHLVWSFSFSRSMFAGFAVFIGGSILQGRAKDINLYMMMSAILLLIGVILSPY